MPATLQRLGDRRRRNTLFLWLSMFLGSASFVCTILVFQKYISVQCCTLDSCCSHGKSFCSSSNRFPLSCDTQFTFNCLSATSAGPADMQEQAILFVRAELSYAQQTCLTRQLRRLLRGMRRVERSLLISRWRWPAADVSFAPSSTTRSRAPRRNSGTRSRLAFVLFIPSQL